jgi:hypothetical protein
MVAVKSELRILGSNTISSIDAELNRLPPVESPVECRFTPGLMSRQVFMPAGSLYRSKIHKTEHQYIVSQGACFVSENGGPQVLLNSPYHGITKPGTWRTLFIITDCVWTTFHPTNKTSVEEVEADIIQPLEDIQK